MKKTLNITFNKISLSIRYITTFLKLFFIKLQKVRAQDHWRLSKKGNYYNPTIEATVFNKTSTWMIARHGNFFGNLEKKEDAMNSIFHTWLKETDISNTIFVLQEKLEDIKHKIFGFSEYDKNNYESHISETHNISIEKNDHNVNFKSRFFYLAQTYTKCYKCKRKTLAHAIILPENFETIDHITIDDLEAKGIHTEDFSLFCHENYQTILSYITYFSPHAIEQVYKYINKEYYKMVYSSSVDHAYYRSICQYCNSAQGDNFLINEFNSAFYPVKAEDFNKIEFYRIDSNIEIRAGSNSVGYPAFQTN